MVETRASAEEGSSRLRHVIPDVVLILCGVVSAFHPTLFSAFRLMQTDPGDTRLNNFTLEHGYRWLLGWMTLHPISLWDHPIFFPAPNTGAYTEILLGSGPLYWGFRALHLAPDTAFQVWMISVLVLDFVSMRLFLSNGLRFGPLASSVGGFLFAFASPRIAQLGHQQMLPQFFTMFALYGLVRFFQPRRVTATQGIYLFFLCCAAQVWASVYLGWFLGVGLLVMSVWTSCLRPHREKLVAYLSVNRAAIARGATLFVVLVAPLVFHYATARRATGARPWWDAERMVPPLQSWLYLGPQSWLYSWQPNVELFARIATEHEQRLGIGWFTLVLAIVGLYMLQRTQGGWTRVMCLSSISLLVLVTLYPGGFTIWKLLFRVLPGANAIRGVARVVFVILIPLSIGLAYLVETRSRWSVALLIAALCAAEQGQAVGSYDKFAVRNDVSRLASRVGKDCGAFYYSPLFRDPKDAPLQLKLHIDAMWAALETGIPTMNGYSGKHPPGWWDLWDNRLFDEQSRLRAADYLRRWTLFHHLDPARVCWIDSP